MELDARKAVLTSLDEVQQRSAATLLKIASEHRGKLDRALTKALASLPMNPDLKLDLGPEPEVNEAVFAGLTAYAEAARKAGVGNRDCLISNSFGQGSFFSDFLSSFGRGILGGVFNPESVKGINGDVVKASFNDLAGTVVVDLKENLADAKDSFKTESSGFLGDVTTELANKAQRFSITCHLAA